MGENIVYMSDWKKQKEGELESLVPNPFKNLREFLGYCETHSKTPRAGFHLDHANALCSMAGYPLIDKKDVSQKYPVVSIYEGEMREILDIIDRKRNSIDVKFERVE
ncbi:hypothetical protein HY449_04315 [Candidatus Pacearchaeota archaeon]|nr:hypothetical protein [Candidatus Pacearchaeota archaeon]